MVNRLPRSGRNSPMPRFEWVMDDLFGSAQWWRSALQPDLGSFVWAFDLIGTSLLLHPNHDVNGSSIVGHANPVVRPGTRRRWPVQLLLTGGAGLRFSVNSLSKNAHFHFKRTSAYRSVELHEARRGRAYRALS